MVWRVKDTFLLPSFSTWSCCHSFCTYSLHGIQVAGMRVHRHPWQGLHKLGPYHETERRLLLGRKVMTNLNSIFKSWDITLPTKVSLVKAMVFPVVIYGCESWTVKNAEHRRIDAFELWCWRRLLRVPWTARRSNQSILKEIIPGISLEGMMLKPKLQYFGHLIRRVDWERLWCWEGLGAGGEGDDRGWDGWMASPTQWKLV